MQILLLLPALSNAQFVTDTLRLYYEINERASERNDGRIDSLAATLRHKVVSFRIFGYADFLADNDYNRRLSNDRAEAVRARLAKKVPSPYLSFVSVGRGEEGSHDNASSKGEPSHRRVDVIFTIGSASKPVITTVRRVPPDTAKKKKSLHELSVGESAEIEGLSFQPGRHFIMPESKAALDNLLKVMDQNPSMRIEIQGHICCSMGPEDGIDIDTGKPELSLNRAKSVFAFLVKNGVSRERMTFVGYGRTRPKVDPERTPEEEQMNRRVEILVTSK